MSNKNIFKKKYRYLMYLRKSSENREKQALSIPAQEKKLSQIAKKEILNCVNLQNPFKEEKSAFKPGRPGFNKMLDLIEQGAANAILVWEISRLSRCPLDSGRLRQSMEDGKLREVKTAKKAYKDSDSLLMDIELAMANKSSKDTSERTKRNIKYKAKNKKEKPGLAPLGYLNISRYGVIAGKRFDKKKQGLLEAKAKQEKRPLGRIEIDPILGPLIKKLFNTFATGLYSLGMMVELVTKWGLPNRNNTPIFKGAIQRILSNPFYYGYFWYQEELCEGSHETLISKALFDKVQKIMKEKSKPISRRHNFLFNGIVKCGECGCSVCGDLKKGKYMLYRCTLKKRHANCSQRHSVSEKDLEEQLTQKVQGLTINKMVYELLMASIKNQNKAEKRIHINGLGHWQRIQRKSEERISRLIDALTDDLISKQEFLKKKNQIVLRKAEAKEKIQTHSHLLKAWHDYAENLLITSHHAYTIFTEGDIEDKKALLKAIGENYQLKDKKISFEVRPPFNFIEQMNKPDSSSVRAVRGLLYDFGTMDWVELEQKISSNSFQRLISVR